MRNPWQPGIYGPLLEPIKKKVFAAGMAGADGVYNNFQTSLVMDRRNISQNYQAKEQLNATSHTIQFTIDNKLKDELTKYPLSAGGKTFQQLFVENVDTTQLPSGFDVSEVFGVNKYAIGYQVYSDAPVGRERFSVQIKADSTTLWNQRFDIPISDGAQNVITTRLGGGSSLPDTGQDAHSLTELRFVSFLKSIWDDGENIYVNGTLLPRNIREEQSPYIGGITMQASNVYDHLEEVLLTRQGNNINPSSAVAGSEIVGMLVRTLYEELLRDLEAMCLTEVGKSKLLEQNIFHLINFAPIPKGGCPDTSLLALPTLKLEIQNIYKNLRCHQDIPRGHDGLTSNWDQPLEQATLYGIIRATVRVYVYEALIKSLITFSQLNINDADEVLVGFVRKRIMDEIRAARYLDPFMSQCLLSWKTLEQGDANETDSTRALSRLITQEFTFAVDKLLRASGTKNPKRRVDEWLCRLRDDGNGQLASQHWLPQFGVFFDVSGSVVNLSPPQRLQQNNSLSEYGVIVPPEEDSPNIAEALKSLGDPNVSNDLKRLVGLKDWRNGNLYLETYLRVEYKEPGDEDSLYPPTTNNLTQLPRVPNLIPTSYRNVVNVGIYDNWFSSMFGNIVPPQTPGPTFPNVPIIQVDPNECKPGGTQYVPPIQAQAEPLPPNPNVIGSYFKTMRYGLRLVCQIVNDDQGTLEGIQEQPLHAVAQNIGGSDGINAQDRSNANKAYLIEENDHQLNTAVSAYTFPIVCSEIEIDPSTEITSIVLDPQFFEHSYNANYGTLLTKLKRTDEYNFIFNYCFPMDRLVSLAALYNLAYFLPYGELNNVFMSTKEQLKIAFRSVHNSGLYKYKDPDYSQEALTNAAVNGQELPGFPWKEMAMNFLLASFRGAAEAFDPNIALAKKIQDAAQLAGQALKGAINKSIELAGKASGQSDADIRRDQLGADPCGDPSWLDDVEIPMAVISMGLMPTFIGSMWIPFGWGPPLTVSLGIPYLVYFGLNRDGLFNELASPEKLSRERCNAKRAQGLDLTGPETCEPGTGQPT